MVTNDWIVAVDKRSLYGLSALPCHHDCRTNTCAIRAMVRRYASVLGKRLLGNGPLGMTSRITKLLEIPRLRLPGVRPLSAVNPTKWCG